MNGLRVQHSAFVTDAENGRLADLYARHAAGAIRLAYMLTGDRRLAEDLVHDAFVKLAGRLAHLRDPVAFDAYLRRTVVNLTDPWLRRKRLERAYLKPELKPVDPSDYGARCGRRRRSAPTRGLP